MAMALVVSCSEFALREHVSIRWMDGDIGKTGPGWIEMYQWNSMDTSCDIL